MINLVVILVLVLLGYYIGSRRERQHYKSIVKREKELIKLPVITGKKLIKRHKEFERVELVTGSVVISVDYFKRMYASLKNIFGGRIIPYESLIDRGRREAVLRMKESAQGASIIANMRIETAAVGNNAGQGGIGSIEVISYGTAINYKS